jgi:adenosine deaminase
MRSISTFVLFFFTIPSFTQPVSNYFEKIRSNAAALTAFFQQMPKGGDLHNHYSGSIYAESFVDNAVEYDFYLNKKTLEISAEKSTDGRDWSRFSELIKDGSFFNYKQLLLKYWSVKDFNFVDYPANRQFFESFGHFGPASDVNMPQGLLELKRRAKAENLSYIETSFRTIRCNVDLNEYSMFNDSLRLYGKQQKLQPLTRLLDSIYQVVLSKDAVSCAVNYNQNIVGRLHDSLQMDDTDFAMRYQTFVIRNNEPLSLFKNIIVAFESANRSALIAGVNIVAPEHYDVAMNDYWLHMQFYNYCHQKYPLVKYSLHAGELTLGLVKPEELTWHINAAIHDAKANRIGHGADIAYEKNVYDLLKYMAKNKIAVEINLSSNEFILGLVNDKHPIMLYKNAGVPIVLGTDDGGILRTSMTEQFVVLAKRYSEIKYRDIKQFVYNSIDYSFIKEPSLKKKLRDKLDNDFRLFEQQIIKTVKNN